MLQRAMPVEDPGWVPAIVYALLSGSIAVFAVEQLPITRLRWKVNVALYASVISGLLVASRVRKDHSFWVVSVVGELVVWFALAWLSCVIAEFIVKKRSTNPV